MYPHPPVAYKFYVAADIGQASDPTAIVIIEKRPAPQAPVYVVKYLERLPLGTSYPAVVDRLQQMMHDPQVDGPARLVVDGTGVGRAIVDMLREARLSPLAISIHGGDHVTTEGGYTRVPKRDLAGIVRQMLDTTRLKVVDSLPEAQILRRELHNFKVSINPATAHDSYSAWREGLHDDLVLAVAMGVWAAEQERPQRPPMPLGKVWIGRI